MRITANLRSTDKMFDSAADIADQLVRDGYDFFVRETPRRTGRARSSTKLQGNKINADYPYAERLDQGASNQAPRGMVEPTQEYWAKRLDDLTRKIR